MFAFVNPLAYVTNAMSGLLAAIHSVVPNYGWDMILLALAVRLILWPLAQQQFKSMAEMQKLQPLLKQLQAKHKGNPQELQQQTMALYKEHGVNPLAGCFPMLIQLPILIALFWAINDLVGCAPAIFAATPAKCPIPPGPMWQSHFLWIGSAFSQANSHIFATSLASPDLTLFALYVISMYLSVRYGSPPSSDPQQAQTQKIMALVSPLMIAYFGYRYQWASALVIYWLALNVFTMSQQFYMYRKFGIIGKRKPVLETDGEGAAALPAASGKSGALRLPNGGPKAGSTSGRATRRSKR